MLYTECCSSEDANRLIQGGSLKHYYQISTIHIVLIYTFTGKFVAGRHYRALIDSACSTVTKDEFEYLNACTAHELRSTISINYIRLDA